MTATVIRAEGISKRYLLGGGYGYKTVRESLPAALRLGSRSTGDPSRRVVWALRDVSFEVAVGDLVGVIGVNGAGKTTLLKVLARITRPTSGRAEIVGRVGSLLEVGTGFHPELTGRENVYLSGAILGMRRTEIKRRYEEIVSFADVDEFLDTPIKRYSSGMKVRLAFAVAAHLEPEILIVDEVLAVGDLAFQKKCLGKMGEVTKEGRTVLFVSHNMSLIRALCRRGILLSSGSVVVDTGIDEAVRVYLRTLEDAESQSLAERTDRRGWQEVRLDAVEISGRDGHTGRLVSGEPAEFAFRLTGRLSRLSCTFTIFNHLGQPVTTLSSSPPTAEDREGSAQGNRLACSVDELLLVPGRYRVDVAIHGQGQLQDRIEAAGFFDVEEGPIRGRPLPSDSQGDVLLPHRWQYPSPE